MALELEIRYIDAAKIKGYAKNSKKHPKAQIEEIKQSIKTFGFINPCALGGWDTLDLLAGHGRLEAAMAMGIKKVPCYSLEHLNETEKRAWVIADNRLAEKGKWDEKMLAEEMASIIKDGFDGAIVGFDDKEISKMLQNLEGFIPDDATAKAFGSLPKSTATKGAGKKNVGSLAAKFLISPFTSLDTRQGWWQDRKRAWLSLGMQGELGRPDSLLLKGSAVTGHGLQEYRKQQGLVREDYEEDTVQGTSVFDPVLTELMYRWFTPKGGAGVLDLFHGGEVRGTVASHLDLPYTGVDLRAEQTEACKIQGLTTCKPGNMPNWITGDSVDIQDLVPYKKYDFLISCPPYVGRELYSKMDNDLSNMSYPVYLEAMEVIVRRGAELLNHDRFAGLVVGDVRDAGTGFYLGLVHDLVQIYKRAGLELYNSAAIIKVAGSAPLRAARQFSKSRKLAKVHEDLLIFVKGDPVKATEACGEVDTMDPAGIMDNETGTL